MTAPGQGAPPSPLVRRDAAVYRTPLREGGSLPAVVEDQEGDLWVVKFRGAGQGPRALVAEIVVAGLAEALELPVPRLAAIDVDATFGQGDRDPEILDILRASVGTNVGLAYLDGAFNLDPVAVPEAVTPDFATRLVWLDALVTNPDRSARNPNLMFWNGSLWLIDHGAALFDHHNWSRVDTARTRRPFPMTREHVLLGHATDIVAEDADLAARLTSEVLERVVARVPDALLVDPDRDGASPDGPEGDRQRYVAYLSTRLEAPRAFAVEAERARTARARTPGRRLDARR